MMFELPKKYMKKHENMNVLGWGNDGKEAFLKSWIEWGNTLYVDWLRGDKLKNERNLLKTNGYLILKETALSEQDY